MFISGGPDKRIKDPFVRHVTYPIFVIFCILMVAPMAYGLLGIVGIFLLLPGFVITYIWAIKRGGMS
jgi:hypothetical protein